MKTNNLNLLFGLLLLFGMISVTQAQEYFPKNDGVKTTNSNYTAFTNAKIFVTPTQVIEKGTLLIKDGKVVSVSASVSIPKNATTIDLNGKSIYPSFIEMYSDFGVEKPKRQGFGGNPMYHAGRKGYYWNDHIRPETNVLDKFKYSKKQAKGLINAGFGVVNVYMPDGIARGTGAIIALNNDGNLSQQLLNDKSAQFFSFRKSNLSRQVYPTSLMGSTALLRQFYSDAKWYAKGNSKTKDLAIEAYNKNKNLLHIFEAGSKLNDLRADKVGDDSGIQYVIVGGGDEFEAIDDIKATKATYILPINFPKAYDVSNPFQADYVSLRDMRYWNQAPSNPSVLAKNNVRFALSTHDLKSPKAFKGNLLKAIQYGLDETKALEALTTIPASILGQSTIGNLKKGSYANFLITSGNIFDKKTKLYENWVQGNKNVITNMNVKDIDGDYAVTINGKKYDATIKGSASKPMLTLKRDTLKLKAKMTYANNWVAINFADTDVNGQYNRLSARVTDNANLNGTGTLANGKKVSWAATKKTAKEATKKTAKKGNTASTPTVLPVSYPNKAYGFTEKPKTETILFKNATVWTNEAAGILKNTDVLLKNGKIAKIGQNLSDKNARVIDATGKHLTTGIIDEHSHIATTSINEAGHNSSAEVTIEDVIDPDDINIYRNLSGGTTMSQILHGSANPIGGRSAIIKLKWGTSADEMILDNSPKFIKFALGENVKQSRAQRNFRFPQSRMGVEQVFMDNFQRAKEYDEQWKAYNKLSAKAKRTATAPRYDRELHTLAEILNKERFISCHSYVQSEINMLMKVAEKFNFNVNTFTHILEGYKVADKMKEHGVAGSTFSDWWAYKYEVNDAIPYNAAIMHAMGVLTAINSDDREMSRRLNQEAAKAVKYGNVSEEDAWKFVTLNPAKMLHVDDRLGSIKIGKDADVVLWNTNPLSIYAKAEKTLIEGKVYFDLERHNELKKAIKKERNDLINMMLAEKNGGAKTQAPRKRDKVHFHCDTLEENHHHNHNH